MDLLSNWNIYYANKVQERAEYYIKWIIKHKDVKEKLSLDVGCGNGYLSYTLNKLGSKSIALDIVYRSTINNLNLDFIRADATNLPFKGEIFDIIVSSDLYEHILNQKSFLIESYRTVKNGGLVSFSTGNKLFPQDRHTGLFFVDILPKRVANAWIRKVKKINKYSIYEPTYLKLKKDTSIYSKKYKVDYLLVIHMFKEVYPMLYRKYIRLFMISDIINKLRILRFLTPKFYVIYKK